MEKVLIVFADMDINDEEQNEFLELVKACDMEVVQIFIQRIKQVRLKSYIGKGKCEEILEYLQDHKVDRVLFHKDLSSLQIRNLEAYWGSSLMDRSELILEIFSRRAKSPTARLQIENAQLKKQLPRLIGANTQLGRQSASGKNKGTGEKQLELDRRTIKTRITQTTRELKQLKAQRNTQRKARQKSNLPLVSLVGYTNAGKSSIMNALLSYTKQEDDKKVLAQDRLFATLDTSIRKINLPYGQSFLLSDTVGFVRDLPHELIEAFHSTLEEVSYADLLLQVIDVSSEDINQQIQVSKDTLHTIKADHIPMIKVYNQCDKCNIEYPKFDDHTIHISAKEEVSIKLLIEKILQHIFPSKTNVTLLLPYDKTNLYAQLLKEAKILHREDGLDGIQLSVILPQHIQDKYVQYIIQE